MLTCPMPSCFRKSRSLSVGSAVAETHSLTPGANLGASAAADPKNAAAPTTPPSANFPNSLRSGEKPDCAISTPPFFGGAGLLACLLVLAPPTLQPPRPPLAPECGEIERHVLNLRAGHFDPFQIPRADPHVFRQVQRAVAGFERRHPTVGHRVETHHRHRHRIGVHGIRRSGERR